MAPRQIDIKGSALIGVVVAILIFSVLAAAIVPMISSSAQQVAAGNLSEKAYLLAESGFRYAAAKYLHAGTFQRERDAVVDELDGNYTLNDSQSRFRLDVYSYFFEIIGNAPVGSTANQYKFHCPGSFPPDMTVAITAGNNPKLYVNDQNYIVTDIQAIPGEDDNVTMTLDQPVNFDPDPDRNIVYPAAGAPSLETQTNNGITLYNYIYAQNDADMFPLRNGRIIAANTVLTYQYNDRDSNRLVDVRDPQNPGALIPTPATPIVLIPQIRVDATGIYGSGASETRRLVTYHTPLPLSPTNTQQEEFTDRFDNQQDWTDTQGTATAIGNTAGNSALQVQSALTSGSDTAALTTFTPTSQEAQRINFNSARHGTRGYLSYDTQLKIGFDGMSVPQYFAAGLSFRLSNAASGFFDSNGYGISFLRGSNTASDGIADGLVPDAVRDQKAIVLWRQTGDGTQRRWLAYKKMRDDFFNDDIENAAQDQLRQHIGTRWDPNSGGRQFNGSTRNWYYGNDTTFTYDFGDSDFGVIESNAIPLPDIGPIRLSFWSWHQTEPQRPADHDLKQVFVRVFQGSGFGFPILVHTIDRGPEPGDWYQETVDLSAFAGETIRIQFGFNTVDALYNNYEGWYVDDVEVYYDWPLQNSTLGVRLQEAMVVRFTDGFPEIKAGSRIYGHNRITTATVMAPPLLSAGDWSESNKAEGILLLNRPSVLTSTAFDIGETLTVIGATGGAAVVAGYTESTDRKVNIIQGFYASQAQGGTGGNTDPLDRNTNPYPRLEPNDQPAWPPEVDGDGNWTADDGNWTSADDYFRLIEWDDINDANATDPSYIPFITKDQGRIPNAMIRDHNATLQSPPFPGILSESEIGLHALGNGATDTYFDDFSIRIDVARSDSVPPPLQQ